MFRSSKQKEIKCDACKRQGVQDKQYTKLCIRCGGRLRSADAQAANPYHIRRDMIAAGIPLGRKKDQ